MKGALSYNRTKKEAGLAARDRAEPPVPANGTA